MAKHSAKRWLLASWLITVGSLLNPASSAAKDLLVFAAASLSLPLQQITETYSTKNPTRVRLSFAGSATLARQISKGAPADLYISANQRWMDYIAAQLPMVASSKRKLMHNRLVVIAPSKSIKPLQTLNAQQLLNLLQDGRLATGDPDHVPAGIYAAQALKHLNLWQIAENKLARLNNVRAALTMVERGATPAGIVYQTDAQSSSKVDVIFRFPPSAQEAITYWAAKTMPQQNTATDRFFEFLFSAAAKAVFKQHGFLVN